MTKLPGRIINSYLSELNKNTAIHINIRLKLAKDHEEWKIRFVVEISNKGY